jgi:hypothetical protein
MVRQGLIRQGVQLPRPGINFDLAAPHISVKFREPCGKLCHVAGAVLFGFFEFGHGGKLT